MRTPKARNSGHLPEPFARSGAPRSLAMPRALALALVCSALLRAGHSGRFRPTGLAAHGRTWRRRAVAAAGLAARVSAEGDARISFESMDVDATAWSTSRSARQGTAGAGRTGLGRG